MCVLLTLSLFSACSQDSERPTQENEQITQSGETEQNSGSAVGTEKTVTLAYSESDSLNPYTAKTQLNLNLSSLLYDSLYRLDSAFSPQSLIVQAGIIEGLDVTVTLKDGLFFTDKTALTAADVCESFEIAKKSDNYAELVENIASATQINKFVVKFRLSSPDAFAFNCLTFPIIKSGQGDEDIPTGSGRYRYSSGKLLYNSENIRNEKANFKTIRLFNIKSSDYESGALQIGNVSFIFRDFADGETQRIIAAEKKVTLNNLVFLSFNESNELLKNKNLRRIISLAINRQEIAQGAFRGYAKECDIPFNPDWEKASEIQPESYTAVQITEMLEKYNYRYASATDAYRRDKKGKELSFKLAVNKNNAFRKEAASAIKSDLSAVGIKVQVELLSRKEYLKAVKSEKFDMYLGEIKLCENMNLDCFFSKGGKAKYGINLKSDCISNYTKLLSGKISVSEFVDTFRKEMPFAPVCFRCASAAFSNELNDNAKPCAGDLFSNINEWSFK